jgi:ATP phosphoribosyltransferase regulatory subunit HisZ
MARVRSISKAVEALIKAGLKEWRIEVSNDGSYTIISDQAEEVDELDAELAAFKAKKHDKD